ncbi:hypothetical protein HELRODRAFT_169805 [Helobdella robusta]|uniref:Nitrate/nitrite sensing protein domain-containing protein n=1 Tax=Helobdella robusta TaxID=6412 RepID=T1F2C3_HELRO|nr:hypothetical protein HELRODRAFT_169805 [Helobdella robusta]ESO08077.1 hypothetical protein HELRODRAFT_169805 [Helobdella robusta]
MADINDIKNDVEDNNNSNTNNKSNTISNNDDTNNNSNNPTNNNNTKDSANNNTNNPTNNNTSNNNTKDSANNNTNNNINNNININMNQAWMGSRSKSTTSMTSTQMEIFTQVKSLANQDARNRIQMLAKMLLVVALPILALIIMTSISLNEAVVSQTQSLKAVDEIKELEKRGTSVWYLTNIDTDTLDRLLKIYKKGDDALESYLDNSFLKLTVANQPIPSKKSLFELIHSYRNNTLMMALKYKNYSCSLVSAYVRNNLTDVDGCVVENSRNKTYNDSDDYRYYKDGADDLPNTGININMSADTKTMNIYEDGGKILMKNTSLNKNKVDLTQESELFAKLFLNKLGPENVDTSIRLNTSDTNIVVTTTVVTSTTTTLTILMSSNNLTATNLEAPVETDVTAPTTKSLTDATTAGHPSTSASQINSTKTSNATEKTLNKNTASAETPASRNILDEQTIESYAQFDRYTVLIMSLINYTSTRTEQLSKTLNNVAKYTTAFTSLLLGSDFVGQMRALGTKFFQSCHLSTEFFVRFWIANGSAGQGLHEVFLNQPDSKVWFDEKFVGKPLQANLTRRFDDMLRWSDP